MIRHTVLFDSIHIRTRRWVLALASLPLGFAIATMAGCATWQQTVKQSGLANTVVSGTSFRHRVLTNPAGVQAHLAGAPVLWHVYIEGDGRAVNAAGRPTLDPTPRDPLLLPVMAQDPTPALYLGRPCYFDTGDPACNPTRWTLERYSEATVDSLAAVLRKQIHPDDSLVFIGHSGGGTLATLLAARLPQTRALVTVAGNLDLARWIEANDYTPLPACLDPIQQPPLPAHIHQWHLAGAQDPVIKAAWIQDFAARQPDAKVIVLEQADHREPWAEWLPNWLKNLDIASTLPR
ncbi:MAG TPA: alpha/beta hydrolase [Dongiaceae bacterium]|nr:alpha/beta hydrolase [Dongiaceae bacterium]